MIAAQAIDMHAKPAKLLRDQGGAYNADGEWIESQPAAASIMAVIQPSKGTQLLDLPEGLREKADYFFWSRSAVSVDDRVEARGKTFRVVFTWDRPEGGFYRAALGLMK